MERSGTALYFVLTLDQCISLFKSSSNVLQLNVYIAKCVSVYVCVCV